VRVGVGYDSHRFAPGRRLVLGGVAVPFERGLAGHSDGDVAAHAVADALLGAAALGDLGQHFPPDDPAWRDANSLDLLAAVGRMLAGRGLAARNVDVTVVCEAPRLAPHIPEMRERLAAALGLPVGAVSVKAKSNEGMGWVGRGEGIAAVAVALVGPAPG